MSISLEEVRELSHKNSKNRNDKFMADIEEAIKEAAKDGKYYYDYPGNPSDIPDDVLSNLSKEGFAIKNMRDPGDDYKLYIRFEWGDTHARK